MSTRDLFNIDAEVGSDDDDEFDEETGEIRSTKTNDLERSHVDDSSEEEDDEEDADAARAIREGFIVDEDEDEGGERREKKAKRKRRRGGREDQGLDEEDLDLIGELPASSQAQSKFKRLKRGHREERTAQERRGVDDIFDDENDDVDDERGPGGRRDVLDDIGDFIEEDEFPEDQEDRDDIEVSRQPKRGLKGLGGLHMQGLDESAMEDMKAAFGDGGEYDWALQLQENMDDEEMDPDKPLELKDVFEPSQLADKMLTEEDNIIRSTDIPERFQLDRKPFLEEGLSKEERTLRSTDESIWISQLLWPKKRLDPELRDPFQKAIASVLEFANSENLEVPFIFQHRKDYLIHATKIPCSPDPNKPGAPKYEIRAQKLLHQGDLWEILELDQKYRALLQKRQALQRIYEGIRKASPARDDVVETLLPDATNMEEVQDIQDYVQFQYSAEIKDGNLRSEINGTQKRARASGGLFERVRASRAYSVVRGFGVNPDAYAQSVLEDNRRGYTDDPQDRPDDMADHFVDPESFPTGTQVLRAAKVMFAEELAMSPRMRKLVRKNYFMHGQLDCQRTEKGLKRIDEEHPYYEFKYLRRQPLTAIVRRPELFLRMLKAEEEGLAEVQLSSENKELFVRKLQENLESDNFSEIADAWNGLRREALDMALVKLDKMMIRGVKETLKTECENQLARICREEYSRRLDQAPYKPKGMELGERPRVLAFTDGGGTAARDTIHWAWVEENGRVLEHGLMMDLRLGNSEKGLPDASDVSALKHLVERRKPDVIGVSGYSPETRTLYKDIQAIVEHYNLQVSEFEDEDGNSKREKVDVVVVNDEVARLYHRSDRAQTDYPSLPVLTRYCVALAKYLQSPIKEYAALGRDVTSISFDPNQNLLPPEKLVKHLDTAMVDMVNLVGVDINEAVTDSYAGNLLNFICGLGPRKATAMIQAINRNGGQVASREELVGDPESGKLQAVSANIFQNCASFLRVNYDTAEPTANYLDSTRVHPEDYELAKKMASDAMDLDEEDIHADVQESGDYAIVRRLVKDDEARENVNDLILELYAEQLESQFSARKRATLETIRAELQTPYEELRRNFTLMNSDEIFTMFTGETKESLTENMLVPISIKRIFNDHLEVRLDCGVEGGVGEGEYPSGVGGPNGIEARQFFRPHQILQAKLTFLNRKALTAQLSLREESLRRPYRKELPWDQNEWDDVQEAADKRQVVKQKEDVSGRSQRVVKHPLFRSFNSKQAEEYLGPQARGDCVIRPSSKGLDHLTVTWKVADNCFQHIDVLELDKENEFTVGRLLRIGGRYTYSDLDELIVNHVKAMAKKVDEITVDERYQVGGKQQAGKKLLNLHSHYSNILTKILLRAMASSIYGCQRLSRNVRLLHQPRVAWLLLPLL